MCALWSILGVYVSSSSKNRTLCFGDKNLPHRIHEGLSNHCSLMNKIVVSLYINSVHND